MIKRLCNLCRKEVDDGIRMYIVNIMSYRDGDQHNSNDWVCPGCASVIMDTISKLRVEES